MATAEQSAGLLNDPAVQELAKQKAYEGLEKGKELGSQAMDGLAHYIKKGPTGVSFLCFVGGVAMTVCGVFETIGGLLNPFSLVLNVYLCLFGIVTVLLEADAELFRSMKMEFAVKPIMGYQAKVNEQAQFLTTMLGRGGFYIFLGTLAISQCIFCLYFLVGIWMIVMGAMLVGFHFGYTAEDYEAGASRARAQMAAGMQQLSDRNQPAPAV
eukprot:CAMPEP_0204254026 /NCGR_PEP_ID=MMETSP0468-20130131/2304_1 /ASSEMBLY_ACC=CAM_ASM_000383 /TAXON_ID=2969 /ORGANISM="Oxyrrhis marina" /LENGTH=211 /DNA_ID=CAMNT_0051227721 /DNA_START=48 /DNA_END=683 /DNA_ORIENTATION=+